MHILLDTHAKVKPAQKPRRFAEGLSNRSPGPSAADLAFWAQSSNQGEKDFDVLSDDARLEIFAGQAAYLDQFNAWWPR